jgi:hypothetical protein
MFPSSLSKLEWRSCGLKPTLRLASDALLLELQAGAVLLLRHVRLSPVQTVKEIPERER